MPLIAIIGVLASSAIGLIGAFKGGGGESVQAPVPPPTPEPAKIFGMDPMMFMLMAGVGMFLVMRK